MVRGGHGSTTVRAMIMNSVCSQRAGEFDHGSYLGLRRTVNTSPWGVHGSTLWMLTKVRTISATALRTRAASFLVNANARLTAPAGQFGW